MNDQEKATDSILLDVLLEEYKIASESRENYMSAYTQTNFYFGLIVATFGFGAWKFQWILVIVPFMIIIQYSIVQWNQYHSFLAEVFLSSLEDKINSTVKNNTGIDPKIGYFKYYNTLFKQSIFLKDDKTRLPLIKPTALLSTVLAIVNLCLFVYSIWKGCNLLAKVSYGIYLKNTFLCSCLVLFVILVYNFLRIPKSMKPILHNILQKFNEEN
jgi:hypothetical protein